MIALAIHTADSDPRFAAEGKKEPHYTLKAPAGAALFVDVLQNFHYLFWRLGDGHSCAVNFF